MTPTGTIVAYTDGSRNANGQIGAGWIILETTVNGMKVLTEGFCNLGKRMEVFDAELHAVQEAFDTLLELNLSPISLYVCIDNSAAVQILASNPDNNEGSFRATRSANQLTLRGWNIVTIWTPSHCGISGNELADQLAKNGTVKEVEQCTGAYTSIAWMKREAKRKFLTAWQNALGGPKRSMSYPEAWSTWSFHKASAIFRVYCGRTQIDPRHGEEQQNCRCSAVEISSKHLIGSCPLLDGPRNQLRARQLTPPELTNELVLDKEWGPRIFQFMQKTGLGFTKDLNWNNDKPRSDEVDGTVTGEDFDVGTFE